jgi:hypothetical protein
MCKNSVFKALLAGVAMAPLGASASTIDSTVLSWNGDNLVQDVALGPSVEDGFATVVHQGDPTSSETNGRVFYDNEESFAPGLVAINDGYSSGPASDPREFDGCLRASAADTCATGFRTGNRFKLQLTDTGSIDLVFDVGIDANAVGTLPDGSLQPNPDGSLYQVFGRAVNLTTQVLDEFTIELGYGVGEDFTNSISGDGLSFAQDLSLGPNGATAFTQFPFGLFGEESTTNRHDLDGFFDDERTGFALDIGEDTLASDGFFGGAENGYEARFDGWLSREMAPAGLLWDDDGDEATDALVMAWQNEDGQWETLRSIGLDGDGNLTATSFWDLVDPGAPQAFGTADLAIGFFDSLARSLLGDDSLMLALETEDNIEDLANLNLNFGIQLTEAFNASSFTLRFASSAVEVAPVPLPASALLLLAGLGAMGVAGRSRSRRDA